MKKLTCLTIGTAFMFGVLASPALGADKKQKKQQRGAVVSTKSKGKPVDHGKDILEDCCEDYNTSRSNAATLQDKQCAKNNKNKPCNAKQLAKFNNKAKPVATGKDVHAVDHNSTRSNKSN